MKRYIYPALLSLASIAALSGCNTMAGFGEDVQKGGEAIEDEAIDCKDGVGEDCL